MKHLFVTLALCVLAAQAAAENAASGTVVELSAEASRSAANDYAQATAYAEDTDASPGEVAKRVNALIASALQTAKAYASISTRTGNVATYPVYAKGSTRVEAWRMRAEIVMETRDTEALSELLGRLHASLAVSQLTVSPAPETRHKAENEATLAAIAAFRAKAKLVADALGHSYRIRQINIGGGRPQAYPRLRASLAADTAPIEGGESQIGITVGGQIELAGKP